METGQASRPAAVICLALGIGATPFSVATAVLLRPRCYQQTERLVRRRTRVRPTVAPQYE